MAKNEKIYPPNRRKPNIQKDILKILAEKPAISITELNKRIHLSPTPLLSKEKGEGVRSKTLNSKGNYALTRSLKNLVESGCIEIHNSSNQKYVRITKKGKNKLDCIKLSGEEALVSNSWDGFWRIVILDIPENRKSEREALRYLLKKANFTCIKNTVWISPFPYENLFTNIKKDLGLGTELMIIVTNKLDPETNFAFLKNIEK